MRRIAIVIGLLAAAPGFGGSLVGQESDVGETLAARGAPADFAQQVVEIVARAGAQGLPTEPLVDKALEGWAKRGRVPPARVVNVLEQLAGRLLVARDETVRAGLTDAPGGVVAAAAEALGRGMSPAEVQQVIASAPAPQAAATALTVAASLTAQGLASSAAVRSVGDAFVRGEGVAEVLELPSVVAALTAGGVPMSEVARQILEGKVLGGPGSGGRGPPDGRPGGVPPARGPVTDRPVGNPKGPPSEPPGSPKGRPPLGL